MIRAPRNVFDVLLMIIGVFVVISRFGFAIPNEALHSLVPSKTAALTPDLIGACSKFLPRVCAKEAVCSLGKLSKSSLAVNTSSYGRLRGKGIAVAVGVAVVVADCVGSSFFSPSLLLAGVTVASAVAVGIVVEVALASFELLLAVVAGVLALMLFSWVTAGEDCAAESPLQEINRRDNVVQSVTNIALGEFIISIASIVTV